VAEAAEAGDTALDRAHERSRLRRRKALSPLRFASAVQDDSLKGQVRRISPPLAFSRDHAHPVWHGLRVTTTEAIGLLEKYKAGGIGREKVLQAFLSPPVADLGFAKVDLHRALRKGFPEVIFGSGKTPEQVVRIAAKLAESENCVLITRVGPEHARAVKKRFKKAVHREQARCITIEKYPTPKRAGTIAVVCAGTSDLPVAEEASVTAEIMGNRVERIVDVGVAGIHRLFQKLEVIQSANVVIVVAGMEGALPSVVAGLVRKPVIAVPTSVGYGASFGGLAALLGMLNTCGSGVTVVNIDNGFGAGYAASQINALLDERNI
jgi:pyridinium-3,5-biscarboxylic acid mononucleotide synthase